MILQSGSLLVSLTLMKKLTGTKSMIPKQLLRDDITIGESFARAKELWVIMCQCWRENPEDRHPVWEVNDRIAKLLQYPLEGQEHVYVTGFKDEQDQISLGSSEESSAVSYSAKMADLLEFSDTASTMSLQYNSLHSLKESEVNAIHSAEEKTSMLCDESIA